MESLKQRILKDGRVYPGEVLKVDSFLNHQIDPALIHEVAVEFARLFQEEHITKVLTIEASGIAIAVMTAYEMGVPMVFAKKSRTANLSADVYATEVASYTHGTTNHVMVSKSFLSPEDRVLIVDDFLARGEASEGLIRLVEQAGASLGGVGIVVEKGFQPGGAALRARGIHLESLAIVEEMDDNGRLVLKG